MYRCLGILTATLLEMRLEHASSASSSLPFPVRVDLRADFSAFGGTYKAYNAPYAPPHLLSQGQGGKGKGEGGQGLQMDFNVVARKHPNLLKAYVDSNEL